VLLPPVELAQLLDDVGLMGELPRNYAPAMKENPNRSASLLRGGLESWRRAVHLQRERVLAGESGADRHIDTYFCVIALSQVVEAARAMERVTHDTQLQKALKRFQNDAPHAKDLRDILSHFGAYQRGVGNLQKAKKIGELLIFTESGDDRQWLRINHLKIEIGSAEAGAGELAAAAFDASARVFQESEV